MVEELLGVDGVSESALYAMGVGQHPEGVSWAPWPDDSEIPALTPADYAARFERQP